MGLEDVARGMEKRFGLPKLSEMLSSLDKIPDARTLKVLQDLLSTVERLMIASKNAPAVDQLTPLLHEINDMPMEKMDKLLKILKTIEGIIEKAPADLLGMLSDIAKEK
jgi:hypothetical protein